MNSEPIQCAACRRLTGWTIEEWESYLRQTQGSLPACGVCRRIIRQSDISAAKQAAAEAAQRVAEIDQLEDTFTRWEGAQATPCPVCHGARRSEALLSVLRDGQRRCEARTLDCPTCRGFGEVTEEHAERLRKGEEMRQDRLRRGLSGREEAKRLGIDPITLNHLEHGREA